MLKISSIVGIVATTTGTITTIFSACETEVAKEEKQLIYSSELYRDIFNKVSEQAENELKEFSKLFDVRKKEGEKFLWALARKTKHLTKKDVEAIKKQT